MVLPEMISGLWLTLRFFKSVHGATRKTLLKIRGFSEIKVEKVKEAVQKCLVRLSGLDVPSYFFANCLALCLWVHHCHGT